MINGKIKKRIWSFLMILCMLLCNPGIIRGAEDRSFLTEEQTEAEEALQNDPNVAMLLMVLQTMDEAFQSEEFNDLMQHPEMQELMLETVKRTLAFAVSEPETLRKVLEALEIEEPYINLFFFAVDTGLLTSENLEGLWETKEKNLIN